MSSSAPTVLAKVTSLGASLPTPSRAVFAVVITRSTVAFTASGVVSNSGRVMTLWNRAPPCWKAAKEAGATPTPGEAGPEVELDMEEQAVKRANGAMARSGFRFTMP